MHGEHMTDVWYNSSPDSGRHISPYLTEPTRLYANIISPGYVADALGNICRLCQLYPHTIAYSLTRYANAAANQLADALRYIDPIAHRYA